MCYDVGEQEQKDNENTRTKILGASIWLFIFLKKNISDTFCLLKDNESGISIPTRNTTRNQEVVYEQILYTEEIYFEFFLLNFDVHSLVIKSIYMKYIVILNSIVELSNTTKTVWDATRGNFSEFIK